MWHFEICILRTQSFFVKFGFLICGFAIAHLSFSLQNRKYIYFLLMDIAFTVLIQICTKFKKISLKTTFSFLWDRVVQYFVTFFIFVLRIRHEHLRICNLRFSTLDKFADL
jgi:hypothetical protein